MTVSSTGILLFLSTIVFGTVMYMILRWDMKRYESKHFRMTFPHYASLAGLSGMVGFALAGVFTLLVAIIVEQLF